MWSGSGARQGVSYHRYNAAKLAVTHYEIPVIHFYIISLCLLGSASPAGRLKTDGKMHVTLCQLIELWDTLTETQRRSLVQRYESGCDCKVEKLKDSQWFNQNFPQGARGADVILKEVLLLVISLPGLLSAPQITHCTSIPCMISSPAECLWTDWVMEKTVNGEQAKHFACIKRSDDSCAWYRGAAPPKKDFLDIEDP